MLLFSGAASLPTTVLQGEMVGIYFVCPRKRAGTRAATLGLPFQAVIRAGHK
jgi:hypothetical protein